MRYWSWVFIMILLLNAASAAQFPNQVNVSITETNVMLDFPGGNDLSVTIPGTTNFSLTHSFTTEYPINTSIDLDDIEDIVKDATLAINHSEANLTPLQITFEAELARKNADQQSWFTQTFMPEVEAKNQLQADIDTCNAKTGILENNLAACQMGSNLLNQTFDSSLEGYKSQNTALSWGLSLIMITLSIVTLLVVIKVLKQR